jgi:hypothetical protein
VVAETLPPPWPQETLPAAPAFYQEIAGDGEQYGVLDLPIRPYQALDYGSWHVAFSSYYQVQQMAHGKGIAAGYIDRPYTVHPLFGQFVSDATSYAPTRPEFTVDGVPTNRYANVRYELARHGYRYVVWHKPAAGYEGYTEGSWGQEAAETFLHEVFPGEEPVAEDELARAYAVGPTPDVSDLTTTLAPRPSTWQSWLESETGKPWSVSPATYYLASPRAAAAHLEITPLDIHDPVSGAYVPSGRLTLAARGGISATAVLTVGQATSLPLPLSAGSDVITLTLRPLDAGPAEDVLLDFTVGTMNLRTTP